MKMITSAVPNFSIKLIKILTIAPKMYPENVHERWK